MEATASTLHQTFAMGPRGPNLPGGAQQQQQTHGGPSHHQAPQGPHGAPKPQEPPHQAAHQGPYGARGPQDPPQQTSQGGPYGGQRSQQDPPPPQQPQYYRPPQHHKPFFYVQPAQPYMPLHNLQWPVAMPMSMPYNPMVPCGYPGLGYGMQMMPPYQPSPYLEPPGYVLPQTHLHLMDYRRMLNPHHYQTMAYHSRWLRYQRNSGAARETTSSEVQTEPLAAAHGSNTPRPEAAKASSGLPVYSNDNSDDDRKTATATRSPAACRPPSPAPPVKDKASPADRSSCSAAPARKSTFVIQTEELMIECCRSTPMGLDILGSPETADLVQQYSHNVVQCRSISEGHVPEEEPVPVEQGLQARPDVLLVGAPLPSSGGSAEQPPALEASKFQREPASVALDGALLVPDDDQLMTNCTGLNMTAGTPKTVHFKVLHLPFDTKHPEELQKMDSTRWSLEVSCTPTFDHSFFPSLDHSYMFASEGSHSPPLEDSCVPCLEDTRVPSLEACVPSLEDSCIPQLEDFPVPSLEDSCVPSLEGSCIPPTKDSGIPSLDETCIPSSEWLIHLEAPVKEPTFVEEVPLAEKLVAREDVPVEEPAPQIEISSLNEDPVVEVGPSAGDPLSEMDPLTGLSLATDVPVTEEVPTTSEVGPTAEGTLAPNSLWVEDNRLVTDISQQRMELDNQDHQETSFESLPAYLPSTHGLADFEHAYYNDNVLRTPQKQRKAPSGRPLEVPGRARKLDLQFKEHHVALKPTGELINSKGMVDRRSLSDHECFAKRKFDGNMLIPCGYSGDQVCARCLPKHRLRLSTGAGPDARLLKRNSLNFQPLDDALLPTCEACKAHLKKRVVRRVPGPNVPGSCRREDDTEGETSENSHHLTGPKRRGVVDHKRPLSCRPHFEKCPVALYPKLGEKNCVCDELLQHHPVMLEGLRRRTHSNAMREMNRENFTVPGSPKDQRRNVHPHYLAHKWPTERSWNATEVLRDAESRKNGIRSQHLIKHRISQSQGIHGTDTRQ